MWMSDTTKIASKLRIEILKMIHRAKSGHPGGSLSVIDVLTCLYFARNSRGEAFLKYQAQNPNFSERDYLILSKGHCSPALYAVLGEAGFFPKSEWENFRQISSLLQGHPVRKVPGVEMTTGSLGQGLSVACGLAANKRDKKVYAILGDGELEEGQIWEAIMSAAQFKLNNLIAIVDRNHLQIDGETKAVMNSSPLEEKITSFNWRVYRIRDGHDHDEIIEKLEKVDRDREKTDKPALIIAETIKGKGVSFMEGKASWHGNPPSDQELEMAIGELS